MDFFILIALFGLTKIMSDIPEYEEKIVAFIDILGFSNLIKSLDDEPELHELLYSSLETIKSFKTDSESEDTVTSEYEVSCFSDSIVISGNSYELSGVVWAICWLQLQLLTRGILIRGAITKGKLIHSNDILYGQGMLKAYELESKVSVYPRVILDPEMNFSVPKEHSFPISFLKEDVDGLYYVDPFSFPGAIGKPCPAICSQHCDEETILQCDSCGYLSNISEYIEDSLQKIKHAGQLAKWQWLKKKLLAAQERENNKIKKLAEPGN